MVTAALAREQGFVVHAVTIDYGQRHRREIAAASAIAKELGVKRHIQLELDMRSIGGACSCSDAMGLCVG